MFHVAHTHTHKAGSQSYLIIIKPNELGSTNILGTLPEAVSLIDLVAPDFILL